MTSVDEIRRIFGQAVKAGSSDLHLVSGEPPIIRIDGKLQKMPNEQPLRSDVVSGFIQ